MKKMNPVLNGIFKRFSVFFLILALVLPIFPVISFEDGGPSVKFVDNPLLLSASAEASLDTGIDGLSATYDSGWSGTTTITGKVTSTSSTSCGTTSYTTKSCYITFTNTLSDTRTLKFTYNEYNLGKVEFSGVTDTKPTNGSIVTCPMAKQDTLTIKITSHDSNTTDTKVTLSNISFEGPKDVNTTFKAASHGSYTVDGAAITADTQKTKKSTESYNVVATADPSYIFSGWYINGTLYSSVTSLSLNFTENSSVEARFAPDPLAQVVTFSGDTSLTKFDVADYYSYYEPEGYTHVTGTESNSHPSNTATALNYNSYEGIKSSANGQYIQRDMDNVSWTYSGTSITASRSGTSYGDNSGYSNKDGSVKTNAKVLRIHALQTINVSFDYSATEWMEDADNSISNGRQIAFFYSLITDSTAPNLTALKGGTSWGGTTSSYLENATCSGHFEETISEGQYLYLWFCGYGYSYTSGSNNGAFSYSFSSAISNVVIRQEARQFDLQSGAINGAGNMIGGGTVTVNNQDYTVGGNGLTSTLTGLNGSQHMTLSVKTVPAGYTHIGWRIVDNGASTDVFDSDYEFNIESDSTVYALFSPKITVTAGGTNGFASATYSYINGSGANQYIARSSDGSAWYKDLNTAFNEQNTVVLVTNVDLSGTFTIPSGKTLSVPYNLADAATTALQSESGSGTVSSYITLTVKNTLTVSGNLVASARQEQSTSGYGRIFGKAGYVKVDGSMSVSGTGKLYAYGMITGAGQINVASDGYVYELAEFRDMREIQAMMDAYNHGKAFPFSHFFIKNNEVSTTYAAGSYLKAKYYVNVSGITADGEIPIIGKSADSKAMFKIAGGSFTKTFSKAAPYNNKIIFRAENGSDIQTGNFSIRMHVKLGSLYDNDITIDTKNYDLPLCYAYAFEVENGGKITINDNYKMLPGASLNVKNGGELIISNGKKIVFYRANDYDFRSKGASDGQAQGFCSTGYPTPFTKPTDLTYASNTNANVGSAKLIVDGTVTCNGGLYVTNQLTGNTTHSNGYNYLTGTGSIIINSTLSNGSIYEEKQKGSDTTSSVTVAYVPIKGITDYSTATDDGQNGYTSLSSAGTYYGMLNDSNVNIWSTTKATLSYNANGGSGTAPASVIRPHGITITVASNTFTAPSGKVFTGWNTKADGTGTAYAAGGSLSLSADTVLYAQWKSQYTVTFVCDGTTLQSSTLLEGVAPNYTGETPTKAANAQYTYTFSGWSDGTNTYSADADLPAATGNVTYTAQFSSTVKQYEVTFDDGNGDSSTQTQDVDYGSSPTAPANPEKDKTAQYTYTFSGWSDGTNTYPAGTDLPTVSGEVTYTAVYTETVNQYTYTFVNEGTRLAGDTVDYGTQPDYIGDTPTKAADAQYTYEFAGWDYVYYCIDDVDVPEGVTKEFVNDSSLVPAGMSNAMSVRRSDIAATGANLDLAHTGLWKISGHADTVGALPPVRGDMTVTATYSSTVNEYTITWKDGNGDTLKSEQVAYGETPAYSGDTPTKYSTAQYSYTFNNTWTPAITSVTGNAQYTAQFDQKAFDYFPKHSLTLQENINVNFYIALPDNSNPSDYTVEFEWGYKYISDKNFDKETPCSISYNLAENQTVEVSGYKVVVTSNGYKVPVPVAVKEFDDKITATLKCDGVQVATDTFSGSDYALTILEDSNGDLVDRLYPATDPRYEDRSKAAALFTALQDLCKSMINNCAAAQVQFGYPVDKLADSGLPVNERHDSVSSADATTFADYADGYPARGDALAGTDLVLYGYSLYQVSEPKLVIYYFNNARTPVTFDYQEDTLSCTELYNGLYYQFDTKGIKICELLDDYECSIAGNSLKFNVGTYLHLAMQQNDEILLNSVNNLYNYHLKAIAYFDVDN